MARFFTGSRNPNDKNSKFSAAGKMYKDKRKTPEGPALTKDEQYKKMLDERIAKLQEDAMSHGRKTFKIAGTKPEEKPKEFSANAKQMMKTLAQQKLQKEQKKTQKKQLLWEKEKKNAQKALAIKIAADEASYVKACGYFFGMGSDKKDGWSW